MFLSLGIVSVAIAGAQFKTPDTKADEQKKFHPTRGPGSSAAQRLASYQKRLQMEAQSDFSQLLFRNVGSEIQSGRVIQFHVPKNKPNDFYVAYATGGLWRSRDEGQNWTPIFDTESAYSIGDFAISDDGRTIWVGTGENNGQRTSYAGTGVFKSTDGGETWQNMGLAETHRTGRVLMHPKNPNVVYVGTIGSLYSQGPDRGIYKTTDGGKTWSHIFKVNDYTGVIDMEMDPRNPDVIYASAWDRDRRSWNFREGGPGTAVYKTTNGGKTWNKLTNGLPASGALGRIGLAVAESKPDTVYAFIDNQTPDEEFFERDEFQPNGVLTPRRFLKLSEDLFVQIPKPVLDRFVGSFLPTGTKSDDLVTAVKDKKMTLDDIRKKMLERNGEIFTTDLVYSQLFRSDDGGKSWKKTHAGTLGEHGGYYWGKVSVNPKDPNDVLTMGVALLRSRDGGRTWKSIARNVHVDHHVYFFHPNRPGFQVSGNDGGVYFSHDDGESWRHINNMPVGQFTTIAVDNKTPYNIIGGLQDNGTMRGPSNYRPGISDLWLWDAIGGGDGSAIAVDPRNGGDVIYTASQFGAHSAQNMVTRERWSLRTGATAERGLRWNWISPIQISSHHPDIIYLGSNKVHRSLNMGRTWETISPDLTKNKPNGDVPFSTLKDLSESPFKFGVIYVGADDGSVKVTKDHGTTWEDISTPEPDKWVSRVVASRHDRGTVYVSQSGYRDDDWKPYLWKSTDMGKTWVSIVGNLPDETINVVREDPKNQDWLYVGTDLGVFFTIDGGKTWTPLTGGIPRTPVHDFVIQEREQDLVVASHARSVFIFKLADLYRLVGSEASKSPLFVWPISTSIRSNWELRRRQEWSTDDANASPLTGEFWSGSAGEGTIRVLDKDGKAVISNKLKVAKGYNRFSVDLKLESGKLPPLEFDKTKPKTVDEALRDPFGNIRAKYLAAGEYTVEISVGSQSVKTPWKLESSN